MIKLSPINQGTIDQDTPFLYYREIYVSNNNALQPKTGVLSFQLPVGYLGYLQYITLATSVNAKPIYLKIAREGSNKEIFTDYFNSKIISQKYNEPVEDSMLLNYVPINQRLLHKETFFINYRVLDSIIGTAIYKMIVHCVHLKRKVP